MIRKKLKLLKQYLPVSRREHYEVMANLLEVIKGLEIADAHHCQLEMSFIQQFQRLETPKKEMGKPEKTKDKFDPAFN